MSGKERHPDLQGKEDIELFSRDDDLQKEVIQSDIETIEQF